MSQINGKPFLLAIYSIYPTSFPAYFSLYYIPCHKKSNMIASAPTVNACTPCVKGFLYMKGSGQ